MTTTSIDLLTSRNVNDEKLIISEQNIRHVLLFETILRLESKRIYTIIHIKNKKPIVCSKNIKLIEERLNPNYFLRVHRSHVINLQEVKDYQEGRGGNIIMSDDSVVSVAIRKKTLFLNSLYAYIATRNKRVH